MAALVGLYALVHNWQRSSRERGELANGEPGLLVSASVLGCMEEEKETKVQMHQLRQGEARRGKVR